uniref:Maelstrom domain-containing protein n=1 Tax=Glossina pallidipes TaxID=7398 RepID=A0A1B0ACA5_GLOPL
MDRHKLELEQKEKLIKRIIEQTVRNNEKDGELEHKAHFFITVNYFTKTLKGNVYIPAEVSVCEYSLKQGVSGIFRMLINPGTNVYGHQYERRHHSKITHNLPLPPNAMGHENLGTIYNEVLEFLGATDEYPPLYTVRENIHIVVSVLDFLKSDIRAKSTCEQGELEKPKSFHITDALFERDCFEYQSGIACQFNEDKTRANIVLNL